MKIIKNLLLLLLLITSTLVYVMDVPSSRYVRPVVDVFFKLLLPIHELRASTVKYVEDTIRTYLLLVEVQKKNMELSKKVEELSLYRSMYESCDVSLKRLSEDLGIPYQVEKYDIVNAQIIGYDQTGRDSFILINKGKVNGIKEGFLVFSGQSLIGVVERAFSNSSRVITVYSERFSIAATLEDYRKNYVYQGGWKEGKLLYAGKEDPLTTDSVVVVRDAKDKLPAFLIGKVYSVAEPSGEFFKDVSVRPMVDIRKLEYVSILRVQP